MASTYCNEEKIAPAASSELGWKNQRQNPVWFWVGRCMPMMKAAISRKTASSRRAAGRSTRPASSTAPSRVPPITRASIRMMRVCSVMLFSLAAGHYSAGTTGARPPHTPGRALVMLCHRARL